MDDSPYLIQLEQKIQSLISESKFRQAYDLCVQVLEKYPNQKIFTKLKEKIEEAVEDQNEKLIVKKLEECEELWKQEKYADILQILKELQRIAPNDKKLIREYKKTQEAYLSKIQKLKEEFEENQNGRLNKILQEAPNSLPDELFQLELGNPGNPSVSELVKKFKDKLIDKKISEKEDLLNSNKFDAIDHFMDGLSKIDKNNPKIIGLNQQIEKRKREGVSGQQNEFVYAGEKHLDTLLKLKKYDKAIQVCKEILAVKKHDKPTERILIRAERKLFSQTRNMSIDSILKYKEQLKEEYKQNKKSFIRL